MGLTALFYQGIEESIAQNFDINSGCAGMTSEDTAVPFPYLD